MVSRGGVLQFEDELDIIFGGTTATRDYAWAPSSGVLHNSAMDITRYTQDITRDPHSLKETLVTPNMVSHEVEEGEDDDRTSRLNKKQSIDPTPSSSHKSEKEAKGIGEKMFNQIYRLI